MSSHKVSVGYSPPLSHRMSVIVVQFESPETAPIDDVHNGNANVDNARYFILVLPVILQAWKIKDVAIKFVKDNNVARVE